MANVWGRVVGGVALGAAVTVASLPGEQDAGRQSRAGAAAPYEAVVSHLAGPQTGGGYADGVGAAARFSYPWGVAVDAAGSAFVADSANHTIRKVSPQGEVVTIAGAPGSPGSSDGPAAQARFRFPTCVVVAPGGALYICDTDNHTIRKISAAGEVSTVAGAPGEAGFVDGSGSDARFRRPLRAAIDNAGNLLVADTGNHVIRRVSAAGEVITVLGRPGEPGSTDGPAATAQLREPGGLTVSMGSAGVMFWVADTGNHTIRFADDRGQVSTVAGAAGSAGSGDGAWGSARFDEPNDIARAVDFGLVAADTGNHTVRWLQNPGQTTTLAGTAGTPGFADGAGASARFDSPRGIARSGETYWVADTANHAVRKLTRLGQTTTLAGTAAPAGSSDGVAADALFNGPTGVAVGADATVFVADRGNHTIRAIAASGSVSTLAGSAGQAGSADGVGGAARFNAPYAVAVNAQGSLFVTDQGNHTVRLVLPDGSVSTFAGVPGNPGNGDGWGSFVSFRSPAGVAVGAAGIVYVADRDNHTIRAIAPDGNVTTLAGAAGSPGNDDGTGAQARFDHPTGLAIDPLSGEILVADTGNQRVRRVTPAGVVSTLAPPGGASPLSFSDPVAVAADALGAIFVVNGGGHEVSLVLPTGEVRSFAGAHDSPGNVDGAGAAARFASPREIAPGAPGRLYLADSASSSIRIIDYELATCVAPVITRQPQGAVVARGEGATVSVTTIGTEPLDYQWFAGARGDTSSPISGATSSSYTSPALEQSTSFWVRVSNSCGGADSEAATITVCSAALTPAAASFPYQGGSGSVNVTTPSPCPWAATSNVAWISFPSGAAGTGSGTLAYAVAANLGAARSGVITVDGGTHTVSQAAYPRYLVSSVAHLPGAGGTKWRSDLAIVNRSSAEVSLALKLWPYGSGAAIERSHTLAAGATVEWPDVLVSLFGKAATASVKGSVQIDASAPVAISSRTYNQAPSGTYGQSYPAITSADALAAGQRGIIPQLSKSASVRTNVGALNVSDVDVTVAIRLFAAGGTQVGSTTAATISPARYWQQDDIFASSGAGNQENAYATVEVETPGGLVWAYASVIDNATGDPTTIPVSFGSQGGPYLVSSQAHAPGLGGAQWRSSLAVVNPGAVEAPLTLTFWPYGSGNPIVRTYTLPAGAAVEWRDVLSSLYGFGASSNVKGSIAIETPQPVVASSRTYNQTTSGTYGQGYPAITAAQALAAGQIGVIPQLKKSAATRTNVGVLNVGDGDATVAITLFGAGGSQVGSGKTATISPSRYWQQDDIFKSAGAGDQEIAYATVEVQAPGARVWAYGSVIDTATGDPTTVAVQVR